MGRGIHDQLDEEEDHLLGLAPSWRPQPRGVSKPFVWTLCIVAIISVALNVLQASTALRTRGTGVWPVVKNPSFYAGLESPSEVVSWEQQSVYTSSNTSLADAAWDSIKHDSGIVAVDKSWALEKGLPLGSTFPWDNDKALYFVNAYHGLHCLSDINNGQQKNIYRAFMDFRDERPPSIGYHHVVHCLDQLRADVLCTADDTLRVTTPDMRPVTGEGQGRKCRSWEALEKWTWGHPGCFRYGNPTIEDQKEDQVPRMKYCPEGSTELENVRTYFGKGKDWKPTEEPLWSWRNGTF